jgi:septal ring-binding cell division protein DamX
MGEAARGEWIRRAERDRQALARRPTARYAVQLELACEIETLEKAWAWDKPAGTMWLLTTPYRGRTCFRVLWGHYATLAQAQAARAKIPSFFVVPGNRPVAVSVR